jgi:membrane-bound ClpP family serine protease
MSQFNIVFFGLYITLFATPIVAFVLRKKLEPNSRLLFGIAGITLILACSAVWLELSFSGIAADAIVLYAIYLLFGLCVFQLLKLKHFALKAIGAICVVPFIIVPILSVPAVLGVALAVGDYEPLYSVNDGSRLCRVTSYGNATTSTGGYEATIYKTFGFVEYQVDFVEVDNTRKPEITPESVCNAALSEPKS